MAHFLFTTILCALIIAITFLQICAGVDTLLPNQTIAVGQTLISRSQVFEMGFFSPGKSLNRFLGIWYKSTPDIVVWVANRNNPITDSQGVLLAIGRNGTLCISRAGSIIWCANSSGMASNPIIQLLDTGNLVLVNTTKEGSSQSYTWQSFDYPTDTWSPGMKLVDDIDAGVETNLTSWKNSDDPSPGDFVLKIINQGLPELVVYRGTTKKFRTGRWNGLYFCGTPPFPNSVFKLELVFKEEMLTSIWEPFDSSIFSRTTLDAFGTIHRYAMNARKDKWNNVHTFPRDQCDEYGHCGPNGIWCQLWQAWLLWKENKILELMDECLNDTFIKSQVKRCMQVGLLCVQKLAEDRPIMSSVIFMLGTDGAILPEPKEPGFFIERSCSPWFTIHSSRPSSPIFLVPQLRSFFHS